MLDRSTRAFPIETRRGADRYALSLMLSLLMSSIAYLVLPRRDASAAADGAGAAGPMDVSGAFGIGAENPGGSDKAGT